jgi:ElaB/YqjD/DUF883 family membrane-anchored ribosome-binding protein
MEARPSVQSATEKMKSGATEFKDAVANQSSEMWNNYRSQTEVKIRDNPYRSVLIAFGLGALAGLFFLRKK